jgi:hypothetical protein
LAGAFLCGSKFVVHVRSGPLATGKTGGQSGYVRHAPVATKFHTAVKRDGLVAAELAPVAFELPSLKGCASVFLSRAAPTRRFGGSEPV